MERRSTGLATTSFDQAGVEQTDSRKARLQRRAAVNAG